MKTPNKILIGSSSGLVEAPYERLISLLLDVQSGMVGGSRIPFILSGLTQASTSANLDIRGGPEHFTVYSTGVHVSRLVNVEVLRKEALVAIYGGYWYRGEYTLEQHQKGTLIKLSIYNIAPGFTKVFVPFLKEYRQLRNGYSSSNPRNPAFEAFLESIGKQLACKACTI
ncbi:hypothetical protein EHS13_17965 [Paenibacillus psychroresistens]|uniref:Uncharacterized protein n=1 Tax=Paenibacillus psychroresistens TaxID=1778678 RepID=A0A6B8RL99_9BACL|nr:hypothetical protein [Paenibacillus psychroresistens]QGQ96627.1 hypothetical protein EHS13_17965 [Paenibacillus psychroresistens]